MSDRIPAELICQLLYILYLLRLFNTRRRQLVSLHSAQTVT